MVVDSKGDFLCARTVPKLSTIEVKINSGDQCLELKAPDDEVTLRLSSEHVGTMPQQFE